MVAGVRGLVGGLGTLLVGVAEGGLGDLVRESGALVWVVARRLLEGGR